jgi:hypothetical protein
MGHARTRINKIRDRFGLQEVHPSIRNSTARKLASKSLARSRCNERVKHEHWYGRSPVD